METTSDEPLSDLILFVVFACLIVVNILAGARTCVSRRKFGWREFAAKCKGAVGLFFGPYGVAKGDPVQAEIDRRMAAKVKAKMAWAWNMCNYCVTASSITICMNLALGMQRWMSFGQTVAAAVALAAMTVGTTCLAATLARHPAITFSMVMAAMCLFTSLVNFELRSIALTSGISWFTRMMVSSGSDRLRLVCSWNVLHCAIVCYTCYTHWTDNTEIASTLMLFELWLDSVLCVMSARAAQTLRDDTRCEVDADMLRSESSGLWDLLDLVCDVVVQLDDQHRILDGAPRFSALVMSQGRDVKGMRLQEFMPLEEDKEAFERCASSMTAHDSAQGTAPRVLHGKLRDSMGNMIRVELFCVQVPRLVGRSHYVGIREFSDFAPIPECRRFESKSRSRRARSGTATAEDASQPPGADGADGEDGSGSESGSGSEFAESSSTWSSSMGGIGPVRGGGAMVQVETSDVAMQLALVRLMRMCSEPRRGADSVATGDRCCPYHGRVARLSASLDTLHNMACVRNFRAKAIAQCGMCGLLVDEPPSGTRLRCFACLSEVRPERKRITVL